MTGEYEELEDLIFNLEDTKLKLDMMIAEGEQELVNSYIEYAIEDIGKALSSLEEARFELKT
jgi:hypothetical protein